MQALWPETSLPKAFLRACALWHETQLGFLAHERRGIPQRHFCHMKLGVGAGHRANSDAKTCTLPYSQVPDATRAVGSASLRTAFPENSLVDHGTRLRERRANNSQRRGSRRTDRGGSAPFRSAFSPSAGWSSVLAIASRGKPDSALFKQIWHHATVRPGQAPIRRYLSRLDSVSFLPHSNLSRSAQPTCQVPHLLCIHSPPAGRFKGDPTLELVAMSFTIASLQNSALAVRSWSDFSDSESQELELDVSSSEAGPSPIAIPASL